MRVVAWPSSSWTGSPGRPPVANPRSRSAGGGRGRHVPRRSARRASVGRSRLARRVTSRAPHRPLLIRVQRGVAVRTGRRSGSRAPDCGYSDTSGPGTIRTPGPTTVTSAEGMGGQRVDDRKAREGVRAPAAHPRGPAADRPGARPDRPDRRRHPGRPGHPRDDGLRHDGRDARRHRAVHDRGPALPVRDLRLVAPSRVV